MFATMFVFLPLLTGAVDPAPSDEPEAPAASAASESAAALNATPASAVDASSVSAKKQYPIANALTAAAVTTVVTGVATSVLFKLEIDRWWEQRSVACRYAWSIPCNPKTTANPMAVFGGVFGVGSLILTPLSTYLVHRYSGGKGSAKSAFLGATLGTAASAPALFFAYFFSFGAQQMPPDPLAAVSVVLFSAIGFAAPAIGAMIGLNYSHNSALVPRASIVPTRDGGSLALAWEL